MTYLKTYHRPSTVDDALQLLARRDATDVTMQVLAGGTHSVPRLDKAQVDEVIDLQGLQEDELNDIHVDGDHATIGAMVRLQALVDDARLPELLRQMAQLEGPNTLRNAATLGGLLIGADPESELLAALLVFDAIVTIQSTDGSQTVPIADFLKDIPASLDGGVVTTISLSTSGQTSSARVARTPADRPIVAAVARQVSRTGGGNRTRVAVCGIADIPCLVEPEKVGEAVQHPGDFRGSRAYREQMAVVLVERVVEEI